MTNLDPATRATTMSLTLSAAELEKLTRITQLLVSPLDHPTVDSWRSAVNRQLRELLHADSAGFFLPVDNGAAMYSEEHDPAELARYADFHPPALANGRSLHDLAACMHVGLVEQAYGRDYDIYLKSPYYNEYAGKNGAHDTLFMTTPVIARESRIPLAIMHLWHERPDGRRFGERELAVLRLLHPAFRAGVEAQLQWSRCREALFHTIDALGQAIMVYSLSGRRLHQTPAFAALLAADPEAERLRAELVAVMNRVRGMVRNLNSGTLTVPPGPVAYQVRTNTARYLARATLHHDPAAGAQGGVILAALDRLTPMPISESEARDRYGLSPAELRVAHLLARGRSNAEIAEALCISPHTARRHTERILRKLEIRSRAEVGPKLQG